MYYLGVDVGGTNIAVGIVDENNAIIAKASHPTPVPCSEDAFCDAILAVCNDALAKAGLTLDDVPWIGIGCPGTVNRATGIIEFANNLYFKNFKLRDMMAVRTNGKLVILENDANAAAYGEYQAGALAGADNALAITLGTGVGGGIIINIFQPAILCIGGGICNEGETLLAPVRAFIDREQYAMNSAKKTKVCKAQLGNDAGIIGAALLGKQED